MSSISPQLPLHSCTLQCHVRGAKSSTKTLISFLLLSYNSLKTIVALGFLSVLRILGIVGSPYPEYFYKVLK